MPTRKKGSGRTGGSGGKDDVWTKCPHCGGPVELGVRAEVKARCTNCGRGMRDDQLLRLLVIC